ncbi:hypothetical protein [Streptomyces sp. NBC_00582]|uniref:hypothetical protein n=1 Tax=Streptomyces sp. NBC_00582 TaxID=2975783 RepID=UPI002E81EF5F|nr:hypothetical protein [Streptomyces sp. NBC_00582]WUB64422.1 hypothetical protein OG852_30540 [Streptomyces sp. NBC_00582]
MPFDLGAVVPLGTTVRDSSGQLANAGSMALTIGLPDGTSTTVDPVAPTSTGVYGYDYPTVQPGRHTVRWVATGINAGAYPDVFDVREGTLTWIVSLADAKAQLKLAHTTDQDDNVRRWIGATTRAVEWFVGPVAVRTVTETHSVGQVRALALRKIPVLELVSVVAVLDGGTSYDVSTLDLAGEDGVVRRKDGGLFYGPLRPTYKAGRRIVPENISAAAELILQHLARTQYGSGRPQLGTGDFDVTEPIPGLGFAIPNRALQLLSPDQLPPGMA